MRDYICENCDKYFKKKSDFQRHKKRKNPCSKKITIDKKHKCNQCNKLYSTNSSLKRHLKKYCKKFYSGKNEQNIDKKWLRNSPMFNFTPEPTGAEHSAIFVQNFTPKKSKLCKNNKLPFVNSIMNSTIDSIAESTIDSAIDSLESSNKYKEYSETSDNGDSDNSDNSYNSDNSGNSCNNLLCNFCNKTFTLQKNLNRHLKNRCKIKKKINTERQKIYQNLISTMQDKIEMLESKVANMEINGGNKITNITNNNTTNIGNLINIQLVAFGSEDKSHLSNVEIFNLLKKGFKSVPELIKKIHFDNNKPENHNVYIPNLSQKYVMVYNGEEWGLHDREDAIENIFDDGRNFLVIKRNEFEEMLDDKFKTQLKKFDRFESQIDNVEIKKKELLDDIKLILYNKRSVPLNTRSLNNKLMF
jgi:hypothetical protein